MVFDVIFSLVLDLESLGIDCMHPIRPKARETEQSRIPNRSCKGVREWYEKGIGRLSKVDGKAFKTRMVIKVRNGLRVKFWTNR